MDDLELMTALDNGTNMFGTLPPEVRARLFAVVDNPTQETWDNAHSIVVAGVMTTLWKALLSHTTYSVRSKPVGGLWPEVPTRDQLTHALICATSN